MLSANIGAFNEEFAKMPGPRASGIWNFCGCCVTILAAAFDIVLFGFQMLAMLDTVQVALLGSLPAVELFQCKVRLFFGMGRVLIGSRLLER